MALQVLGSFFLCEVCESGAWGGVVAGFFVALTYEAVEWAAAEPGLLSVSVEKAGGVGCLD